MNYRDRATRGIASVMKEWNANRLSFKEATARLCYWGITPDRAWHMLATS